MNHPFPNRTPVAFDIAQGLVTETGHIADSHHDEGWLYHIDVEQVSQGDVSEHVNSDGQLWVCEHEVQPTEGGQP